MSLDIQNLAPSDPFATPGEADTSNDGPSAADYIHIRIQQRNGRKCLTTVQGLKAVSVKKVCKALKKEYNCNGTIIEHDEWGEVIQLQGDQRQNVAAFLMREGIAAKDTIKVHGF